MRVRVQIWKELGLRLGVGVGVGVGVWAGLFLACNPLPLLEVPYDDALAQLLEQGTKSACVRTIPSPEYATTAQSTLPRPARPAQSTLPFPAQSTLPEYATSPEYATTTQSTLPRPACTAPGRATPCDSS